MKDQRNQVRSRLTRCLEVIDDEYIDVLAPLIFRIIAVVQRFFAASGYAAVHISVRDRPGESALGVRTKHRAVGLQSTRTR
jgi:hypothetical protein